MDDEQDGHDRLGAAGGSGRTRQRGGAGHAERGRCGAPHGFGADRGIRGVRTEDLRQSGGAALSGRAVYADRSDGRRCGEVFGQGARVCGERPEGGGSRQARTEGVYAAARPGKSGAGAAVRADVICRRRSAVHDGDREGGIRRRERGAQGGGEGLAAVRQSGVRSDSGGDPGPGRHADCGGGNG